MENFIHNQILDIDNFIEINKSCSYAQNKSKMIGVIGYTGAGKSTALKYYQETNENVLFIERKKSMTTKDFYKEILISLNPNGYLNTSIYNIMKQISFSYSRLKTKCLLIIDESGKQRPTDLEYLHELRENTFDNLGIILAGPEYYFDKLNLWKQKNVIGVPELYRRILGFVWLERPKLHEIRAICNVYEINDEKIIKVWYKKCNNFGEVIDEITKYWDSVNGTLLNFNKY